MDKDALKLVDSLHQRYPGKYVAVVDDKVVAVGKSQFSVYKRAVKGIPRNKEVGVFYIPSKSDFPLLLGLR